MYLAESKQLGGMTDSGAEQAPEGGVRSQGFTDGWVSGADGFSSDWSAVAAVLVVELSGRANVMRGTALETGNGCVGGAKL
jgi:hypothetical protein